MRYLLLATLALIGACSSEPQPPLTASNVIVTRAVPGMTMSAAYLSLTNNSSESIRITRVASEQYESVQLHETTVEGGVARMRSIAVLEIPPGETVTLQRGGKHLMLMRPTGLAETVSLRFLNGDDLILSVVTTFESQGE